MEWQSMDDAPRNASEFILQAQISGKEPVEYVAHFAEDLSGEEQPPFKGFFYQVGNSYWEVPGKLLGWRPK